MSGPALAEGVRFRRSADGQGVLLIPEGIVNLNDSAAATIELVNGQRTVAEIASMLSMRYGMDATVIAADIEDLMMRLAAKMWLVLPAAKAR